MARESTVAVTRRIGEHLRRLRVERGWSQMQLARRLHLSQPRLSAIERGLRSLTAEEFLEVLKLFNVPATDFVRGARASGSQLQNALERLGAVHLYENQEVLPSDVVKQAGDVIREVLIGAESPRLIAALAPVLALHADQINFARLRSQLNEAGIDRRLGWIIDNTVEAVRRELGEPMSIRWRNLYRRALLVLEEQTTPSHALPPTAPMDFLDRNIRSKKSMEALENHASSASRRWKIATAIQIEDFVEALRASRVGD